MSLQMKSQIAAHRSLVVVIESVAVNQNQNQNQNVVADANQNVAVVALVQIREAPIAENRSSKEDT